MPRGLKSEAIVLEIGYGKTTANQIAKTLKRFKNGCGLVVAGKDLSLDKQNSIAFIPLKLFLTL